MRTARVALCGTLGVALFITQSVDAQPFLMGGITTAVTRSGGAIGGVEVRVSDALAVTDVTWDGITLVARHPNGATSTVPLLGRPYEELKDIVEGDHDGVLTVSIDPVLDSTVPFEVSELAGTKTGETLLELDSQIAGLLEGHVKLGDELKHLYPPAVARQLLLDDADSAFRKLVARFPTPPRSWHRTYFEVDADAALSLSVEPAPYVTTPDGRRFELQDQDKTIGSKHYVELASAFAEDPESFTTSIQALAPSLDAMRAFGLLVACEREATGMCWQDLPDAHPLQLALEEELLPDDLDPEATLAELQGTFQGLALRGALHSVWNNYRSELRLRDVTSGSSDPEDAAIWFFVDEALQRYSLVGTQDPTDLDVRNPKKLRRFIRGVDLEEHEDRGWAHLGLFATGVWADEPLSRVLESANAALRRARASEDEQLELVTLQTLRRLTPVLRSSLFVRQDDARWSALPATVYDPETDDFLRWNGNAQSYLEHLTHHDTARLGQVHGQKAAKIRRKIETELASEMAMAVEEASDLIGEYHLLQVSHQPSDAFTVHFDVGRMNYILGRSLVASGNDSLADEARGRFRYLSAVAEQAEHSAEQAEHSALHLYLEDLQLDLRNRLVERGWSVQ